MSHNLNKSFKSGMFMVYSDVHTTRKYIYDFTKWNRKTKVSELRGSREFNKKLNELVKHIEKGTSVANIEKK